MTSADGKRRAFLGLGANLGDREATLRAAVASLPDVAAVSPLYETEPVGGPSGQPEYLNLVVELRTEHSARALLEIAQHVEAQAGRVREPGGPRFGPRVLDVDVLLVADERVDEADLVVPHPRMHERRFVLQPLADLAPELVDREALAKSIGSVRRVGTL